MLNLIHNKNTPFLPMFIHETQARNVDHLSLVTQCSTNYPWPYANVRVYLEDSRANLGRTYSHLISQLLAVASTLPTKFNFDI
jgi:hypothetical protein